MRIVEMRKTEYLRYVTLTGITVGSISTCEFYQLGSVLESSNPNAYVQEKRVENTIVRKIGNGVRYVNVVDNKGYFWKIGLDCFTSIEPIKVKVV